MWVWNRCSVYQTITYMSKSLNEVFKNSIIFRSQIHDVDVLRRLVILETNQPTTVTTQATNSRCGQHETTNATKT